MLVNSRELRAVDFHLAEVRPLQLDVVTRGGRRTRDVAVRKLQGVGNSTFVLSVENEKMTSGEDVSEFLDTLGLVKSYFSSFLERKNKKIDFFFVVLLDSPEDQVISLFAGLLSNPDMPLSPNMKLRSREYREKRDYLFCFSSF